MLSLFFYLFFYQKYYIFIKVCDIYYKIKIMFKLYYYYSEGCGSCKNYKETVDKITQELKMDASYIDIATGIPTHHLEGVPTIAINDSQGKTIYKHVGNLPYDLIIKDIKQTIGYDK